MKLPFKIQILIFLQDGHVIFKSKNKKKKQKAKVNFIMLIQQVLCIIFLNHLIEFIQKKKIEEVKSSLKLLSDEQLFQACGGITCHK